ncbi:protein Mpv17-like [Lolium rigidum]|uniref:protein Mpv17-like n=1 Tax=Lolium rigidum TaxID=89674 RepID=UPI001F5DCBD0|nr:protein Mpv17-like [Lolium rigidum]XP_047054910.1 protein Mpv17-like [Lolium rigidum]
MKAIGSGGEWWWNLPSIRRKNDSRRRGRRNQDARGRRRGPPREPLSSSSESVGQSSGWPLDFPFKQAVTAACLTLTGDTIAQVHRRIMDRRSRGPEAADNKALIPDLLLNHDLLRSLRIASYGFLLYGPGSYAWYQFLDQTMPKQTLASLSTKVVLNQIVLGPCVIAIIFAWNNLWLGKLSELPSKYQNDALPTLLNGFKFWIPVSIVNFGMIPLPARVGFMSSCSIFWNFYLSTTMNK